MANTLTGVLIKHLMAIPLTREIAHDARIKLESSGKTDQLTEKSVRERLPKIAAPKNQQNINKPMINP